MDSPASAARLLVVPAALSLALAIIACGVGVARLLNGGTGYNSFVSGGVAGCHCLIVLGAAAALRAVGRAHSESPRLVRWTMASLVFVSLLAYAELAVGVLYRRIPARETPYVPTPEGWRMRAGYLGTYSGVPLVTNSDGYRSQEISLEKPPGTRRVVCLGDSLTFGHGVAAEDAYPQQLEQLLRRKSGGSSFEVLNTGVEGFSTFQETAELRRCLKYEPDAAVLLFCLNDVTEKYLALRSFGGTGIGYHGVADGTAGFAFRWLLAARPYSSVIQLLTPTRSEADRRQAYAVRALWEQPHAPHLEDAWRRAEAELSELAAYCRERNIALLVAVAPYRSQFSLGDVAFVPQRRLHAYLASLSVPSIDLVGALTECARIAELVPEALFLDGAHLNAQGNRCVAAAIEAFLEERGSELTPPWMAHRGAQQVQDDNNEVKGN
ncbi:MAG: hypothetical protein HY763_11330 [Planctomycetes bacterium]|nr:hypothetical protein [Planctomycetota bacterium]